MRLNAKPKTKVPLPSQHSNAYDISASGMADDRDNSALCSLHLSNSRNMGENSEAVPLRAFYSNQRPSTSPSRRDNLSYLQFYAPTTVEGRKMMKQTKGGFTLARNKSNVKSRVKTRPSTSPTFIQGQNFPRPQSNTTIQHRKSFADIDFVHGFQEEFNTDVEDTVEITIGNLPFSHSNPQFFCDQIFDSANTKSRSPNAASHSNGERPLSRMTQVSQSSTKQKNESVSNENYPFRSEGEFQQ